MTRQNFRTEEAKQQRQGGKGTAEPASAMAQASGATQDSRIRRNAEGQSLAEARALGRKRRMAEAFQEQFATLASQRVAKILGVLCLILGVWLMRMGSHELGTSSPVLGYWMAGDGAAFCAVAVWLWSFKKRAERHARKLKKALRIDSQAELEEKARSRAASNKLSGCP